MHLDEFIFPSTTSSEHFKMTSKNSLVEHLDRKTYIFLTLVGLYFARVNTILKYETMARWKINQGTNPCHMINLWA